MNCFKHNAVEVIGVCAYCGRALCRECLPSPTMPRLACSAECVDALARNEEAMQKLLRQSLRTTRASAFYCYLSGGLSAGASVAAYYMLPSPFLIGFTAACAVALIGSGIWYSLSARK